METSSYHVALYVPGNKPGLIERALLCPVPAVVIDLEDGVPTNAKREALLLTRECLHFYRELSTRKLIVVRINPLSSTGASEVELLWGAPWDRLRVPKVSSADELRALATLLEKQTARARRPARTFVELMIESLYAAENIDQLARLPFLAAFTVGREDLTLDLRQRNPERPAEWAESEVEVVKEKIAQRAAELGFASFDSTHMDLKNADAFLADCRRSRAMGFSGRSIIHPAQLRIADAVYSTRRTENVAIAGGEK